MSPTAFMVVFTCALVCGVALAQSGCSDNNDSENCNNCSRYCATNQTNGFLSCNITTGACLYGCLDGKEGRKCDLSPSEDDFPFGIILGAVAAFLVLILIIVVVVVWRKNLTTKRKRLKDGIYKFTDTNMANSSTADAMAETTEGRRDEQVVQELQGTSISVEDLHDFILSHDRQFFQDTFDKITSNKDAAMTVGTKPENATKNRYKDICAFDHNRVKLNVNASKKQGDYINASYVMGYKDGEKFIASQGPTKTMVNDFVRMLWEQQVDKVVMLTNLVELGKTMCEMYWSDDKVAQFDEITVELKNTEVFAHYIIRKLELSKAGQPSQELTQFHFTSWPDKSLPSSPWSLVDFEHQVYLKPTQRPIVVHCSAGVGRTGTFIALRNAVREAEDTGKFDFVSTVIKLRQERGLMVQTLEQFIFLHKAALVATLCNGTTVTAENLSEKMRTLESKSHNNNTHISEEFETICKLCRNVKEELTEEVVDVHQNNSPANPKNRFEDIVPKGYNRPFLMSDGDEINDYINAIFVPTLKKKDDTIMTQLPMPTTISDFWRMVTQYKVSLIVAFEVDMKDMDLTIADYLPPDEEEPLSCPPFEIYTGPVSLGDCWQEQKLCVTKHKPKKRRLSLVSSLTEDFPLVSLKCTTTNLDPKSLLNLMKKIRSRLVEDSGRCLLMCRNGAEYSGLVSVLSLLLDKMDHDQRASIPLTVGTIKAIRPQVIPTMDQYSFLYKILQRYTNSWSRNGKRNSELPKEQTTVQNNGQDGENVYANSTVINIDNNINNN